MKSPRQTLQYIERVMTLQAECLDLIAVIDDDRTAKIQSMFDLLDISLIWIEQGKPLRHGGYEEVPQIATDRHIDDLNHLANEIKRLATRRRK